MKTKVLEVKRIVCNNPKHHHRNPVINMVGFDVNGHFVEVTQDGHLFAVRVDGWNIRADLTGPQLDDYILGLTQ